MTNEQKLLLNRIQVCDFILAETAMFLDTHPANQAALAFFKKHRALSQQATEEYVSKYGPLTAWDAGSGARWNWVDGPWPWEMEKED